MSDFGPPAHLIELERRERKRRALRVKQFVSILTTAGYGLVAGGAWEPLLKAQPFGVVQMIAFGVGLAMLAASIYYAAHTEATDVGR